MDGRHLRPCRAWRCAACRRAEVVDLSGTDLRVPRRCPAGSDVAGLTMHGRPRNAPVRPWSLVGERADGRCPVRHAPNPRRYRDDRPDHHTGQARPRPSLDHQDFPVERAPDDAPRRTRVAARAAAGDRGRRPDRRPGHRRRAGRGASRSPVHVQRERRDCAEKRAIFVKTRGRWRCQNLYMARVALDGRKQPDVSKSGAKRNYLKAGEWVNIRCQAYDYDGHTGERLGLYDKVGDVFVPDKYMRTLYTGASRARRSAIHSQMARGDRDLLDAGVLPPVAPISPVVTPSGCPPAYWAGGRCHGGCRRSCSVQRSMIELDGRCRCSSRLSRSAGATHGSPQSVLAVPQRLGGGAFPGRILVTDHRDQGGKGNDGP